MKRMITSSIIAALLVGCGAEQKANHEIMTSIQIIDRNDFKETISSKDRLAIYEKGDFLTSQPYKQVTRMFARDEQGKTHSKLTTYHDNGELWQYLEVVNGRACGTYREWHSNGVLRIDLTVIEGLGDLREEAQIGWVFDGLSRVWDEQGNLIAEVNYEKGKLQGNANYYHSNGYLKQVIPYENDLIDGDLIDYDLEGKFVGKTPYRKGKREGISIYKGDSRHPPYSEEYQEDLLVQGTYHDFSGKIIGTIEQGNGKQVIYVDGILDSMREYQNGVPQGEVKLFDSNGNLTTLFHVKEGMQHGEEWVYFKTVKNGKSQPKLYIQWYEDAIQGICRTWYPNGSLESEREMMNNQKHGISSAWYQDGTLMLLEEYENDKLVKGSYMKKGEPGPISKVEDGNGCVTLYDPEGTFIKRVFYQKGQVVDDAP